MAKENFKREVISGKAMWAKLNEKNRDFYDENDIHGSYRLSLVIRPDEVEKFEGMGVKVKTDKEGQYFIDLKRPHAGDYDDKETGEKKTWELGPPDVVDENLEVFTDLIGNGSPVNVEVEVRKYGPKLKKATLRMLRVQVDQRTMIRYEGKGLKKLGDTPLGGEGNVVGFNAKSAAVASGETM